MKMEIQHQTRIDDADGDRLSHVWVEGLRKMHRYSVVTGSRAIDRFNRRPIAGRFTRLTRDQLYRLHVAMLRRTVLVGVEGLAYRLSSVRPDGRFELVHLIENGKRR